MLMETDLAIRNTEKVLEKGGWELIGIRNDLKLIKMYMENMRSILKDAEARKDREPPLNSNWVNNVQVLVSDLNKHVRCLSSWIESNKQESIDSDEKTIEIKLRLEVGLDLQALKERAIELNVPSISHVESEINSSKNKAGMVFEHNISIGGNSNASSRLMSSVLSMDGTFRHSEIFEFPEEYDASSPYYNWICDNFFHMYKIVVYIITNS